MTTCEMCGENPAAVFKPMFAVCKPCNRTLANFEAQDNPIPNAPTCGTCGAVLNGSGVCADCVVRSVTEAHKAMRRAS